MSSSYPFGSSSWFMKAAQEKELQQKASFIDEGGYEDESCEEDNQEDYGVNFYPDKANAKIIGNQDFCMVFDQGIVGELLDEWLKK